VPRAQAAWSRSIARKSVAVRIAVGGSESFISAVRREVAPPIVLGTWRM